VDTYKVITLFIMAAFVLMLAALFLEWLLEPDDEDPWIDPQPGDYDDREAWER
jgi:hypothetical protein